jgi:hypothetical protein
VKWKKEEIEGNKSFVKWDRSFQESLAHGFYMGRAGRAGRAGEQITPPAELSLLAPFNVLSRQVLLLGVLAICMFF